MKKRIILIASIAISVAVLIFAALKFNVFSPAEKTSSENTAETYDKADHSSSEVDKPVEEESEEEEKKETSNVSKTTLLIYMIGSDLESRSGAGTQDLEELENSGINLKNVNVVVYAGGAPRWHNDLISNKDNNVLELTDKGFRKVTSMDSSSMGTSKSLTEFLTYGYKSYPADSFALILWDHGNGPVIGYGKDMLFDNDSLTLSEMRAALSASPFSSSNKLAWIGFDACLMSSAELACTLDDYAYYLVASQEIEPSFGWNYDLFKFYGKNFNTPAFLSILIEGYMKACQDYYNSRGFENRDTTLACIDLSKAAELEKSVNALFGRLNADMPMQYNTLVQKRVSTRALGRASTGSEYDLIDLNDMAIQLGDLYPEETSALKNIIQSMVIKNGNNTEGCCGLSLYYPFYNKYYFENSWYSIYTGLDTFENYGAYLENYQNIWLKDDKLENYASSATPTVYNDSGRSGSFNDGAVAYALQLTSEQNENYADARFYIMEKTSSNLYHPIISSENVINDNGLLIANFSGKAIYATDYYGNYITPMTEEYDMVGPLSRYAVTSIGKKNNGDESQLLAFNISVNNSSHKLTTSSIVPFENSDETFLGSGKLEEYTIDDWDLYSFGFLNYMYLTRYDNGTVKPLKDWVEQTYFSLGQLSRNNGLAFKYMPLKTDRYSLIFEITDTQGNKYCSELLPVTTEVSDMTSLLPSMEPDCIELLWYEGEKFKILEKDGITVYIKQGMEYKGPIYKLEAKNDTNEDVTINFNKVIFNNEYYEDFAEMITVPAKSSAEGSFDLFPNSTAICLGEITEISSIEGVFSITRKSDSSYVLNNQSVLINIDESAQFQPLIEEKYLIDTSIPFNGALADKQILFEDKDLRITLITFSGDETMYYNAVLCYENLSDKYKSVGVHSYSLNGITVNSAFNNEKIHPHSKIYEAINIPTYEFRDDIIPQIEDFKLFFNVYNNYDSSFSEPDTSFWCPINFKQTGKDDIEYKYDGTVIYDKNDIKVVITDYFVDEDTPVWNACIINNSDQDISLYATNTDDSGISGFSVSTQGVGAHQRAYFDIEYYAEDYSETLVGTEFTFKLHILDIFKSDILYYSDDPITLTVEEKVVPEETVLDFNWNSGDEILIAQVDGIDVYLMQAEYTATKVPVYALKVVNNNSKKMTAKISDVIINEDISMRYNISASVDPNATRLEAIEPVTEIKLGAIDEIHSISGSLEIYDYDTYDRLLEPLKFKVTMSDETALTNIGAYYEPYEITAPYCEAIARQQVLFENEDVRATLLGIGTSQDYRYAYVCVENLSDTPRSLGLNLININGYTYKGNLNVVVAPGYKKYISVDLFEFDGDTIETMALLLSLYDENSSSIPYHSEWVDIEFEQHGTITPPAANGNVIFEMNGIKIVNEGFFINPEDEDTPTWILTVINDSDNDIVLGYGNSTLSNYGDRAVGAKQRKTIGVFNRDRLNVDSITMNFEFYTYFGNKLLFKADSPVTVFQ